MDLKVGYESVNCVLVVWEGVQRQASVKKVMKLQVTYKMRNFMTC
jgi:hypothetical protein